MALRRPVTQRSGAAVWVAAGFGFAFHHPVIALTLERVRKRHRLPGVRALGGERNRDVRVFFAADERRHRNIHRGDVQIRTFGKVIDHALACGFFVARAPAFAACRGAKH